MLAVDDSGLACLGVGGHSFTKEGVNTPQTLLTNTKINVTLGRCRHQVMEVIILLGLWILASHFLNRNLD